MRYGKPIKYFLFLLSSDTVIFIEKVEEFGLWFFQRSVSAGFKISEIRKYSFFKFLGVGDRSTECEKAICK